MPVPGGGVEPAQWGDAVRSAASQAQREIAPGSLRQVEANVPRTSLPIRRPGAGRSGPPLGPSGPSVLEPVRPVPGPVVPADVRDLDRGLEPLEGPGAAEDAAVPETRPEV